jgi:hypothetical protein
MGGNVFGDKTTSIKKEWIEPTLKAYFNELAAIFPNKKDILNLENFTLLGSAGKKSISGDIDLGIDLSMILDEPVSDESIIEWNIDPIAVVKETELLQKRAKTATPEQSRKKAFFKLITKYINDHANHIYCDEKKVSEGNIFSLFPQYNVHNVVQDSAVQIDWMVGNLDWLKFSYYSTVYPADSNIKGLCRTQLILSMFQSVGLSFNHVNGVKDKETGEILASTSNDAINLLNHKLNLNLTEEITQNYYSLYEQVNQCNRRDTILNTFLRILDSTRVGVPDNLREEWRQRKESLNLTGKFLPENDPMREFLSE